MTVSRLTLLMPALALACAPEVSNDGPPEPLAEWIMPGVDREDEASDAIGDELEEEDAEPWSIPAEALVFHTEDAEHLTLLNHNGAVLVQHPLEGRAGGPATIRGNRIFVSLRDSRSVIVLEPAWDDSERALREVVRIEVGPEPRDLRVAATGGSAWVAVSMEGVVRRVDFSTGTITDEISIPGQPTWLTDVSARLLVSGPVGEDLHLIGSDLSVKSVQLPIAARLNGDAYGRRVTGRPVYDAKLGQTWVPTVYLDNNPTDIVRDFTVPGRPFTPPAYYADPQPTSYADQLLDVGTTRFMPSVVGFDRRFQSNEASLSVVAARRGRVPVRGVFRELWLEPETGAVLASVEGAQALVAVQLNGTPRGPSVGHFEQHIGELLEAPDGAGELQVSADRLWAHGAFDDDYMAYALEDVPSGGALGARFDNSDPGRSFAIPSPVEPDTVSWGRSLFHSTSDTRMVTASAGVACATCHAEGASDNLTWTFPEGKRQTPSLVGDKSLQTPLSWTRDVTSVASDALVTSNTRMGGHVTFREANAIAEYVESVRVPDTRPLRLNAREVARGEIVYGSMACARCHSGTQLTDREGYAMHDQPFVRTPSLLGTRASGPWFWDGRARSLRDVVLDEEHSGPGVRQLHEDELEDLLAYMQTL